MSIKPILLLYKYAIIIHQTTLLINPFQTPVSDNKLFDSLYEGGSKCNENPSITPSTNALGFNAICQTKDQSVAVIMVHDTLFYLSKFSMLQTF